MRFQIEKLIIWPKVSKFNPQIVTFKTGMVNVITGSSRSGKSAIIPIIDYCLASSDCFIPIDTIRDCASWYGIVIETEADQMLIARRVPEGSKVSNEYMVLRGKNIDIPSYDLIPNETTEGVKNILNAIAHVPYFRLSGQEDPRPYQERLGFRDMMALVFQSQEIVANQNIIFYKTHAHQHRERLKNWFPYILGAENTKILAARQRLEIVQKNIAQLNKEIDKAGKVSQLWFANMVGNLQIAKEYGLIATNTTYLNQSELLEAARHIASQDPNNSQATFVTLQTATNNFLQLEENDEILSDEISLLKKRLIDIKRLKKGLIGYGEAIRKRVDRLQISDWLHEISSKSSDCPLCGSVDHNNANIELQKISSSFKVIEDEALRTSQIPTSFEREEEAIKSQLEVALASRKALNSRLDKALADNKVAQEQFQSRKNLYIFLGHFRASLETFESLSAGGDIDEQLAKLLLEEQDLLKSVDQIGVKRRIESTLKVIMQSMLSHLKTLDVEEKYRITPPKFSVNDLGILVLSNDGHWHFLAEVGSASNWVSFHIALMCAFQEYFLKIEDSCVPSFVIFDQPSQVYFPKTKRTGEKEDPKYEDEDVGAVKGIFKTLVNSVEKNKGSWQSIVLDHADSDIYGDIEGVYEVDEWREGKKLIPIEWYS